MTTQIRPEFQVAQMKPVDQHGSWRIFWTKGRHTVLRVICSSTSNYTLYSLHLKEIWWSG